MQKKVLILFGFLILIWLGSTPILNREESILGQLAGAFLPVRVTETDIKDEYNDGTLKVLIVPGHNNLSPGAVYKNTRESDLTVELSHKLQRYFSDQGVTALVVRDEMGEYSKWFTNFMETGATYINNFRDEARANFGKALESGEVTDYQGGVGHNRASSNGSFELYSINAFANLNRYNVVLHVHFNDHGQRRKNSYGKYTGFTVYVPESQLPNSVISTKLGEKIKEKLNQFVPISSLPQESAGIVESQDLIALGSNGSRDGASVLIEYGYIYETQFQENDLRDIYLEELAFQTYNGVMDFLINAETGDHRFISVPYNFENNLRKGLKMNPDVFNMQLAFIEDGIYPPSGKSLSDCPANGNFGPCTETAVKNFQSKYSDEILTPFGLTSATGYFGPATRMMLNRLFSVE